jgi:hypothetical protein
MTRKLYVLLVGAIVSGALVTACGSSSPSSTQASPNTTSTTSSATTTSSTPATSTTKTNVAKTTTTSSATKATTSSSTTATSTSSTTSAANTGNPQNLALAVAICKAEISKLTPATLTSDEKAQLEKLCNLAGSGNTAQLKAAEKQICLTVIKDSAPGLSGTALAAAEQSCNKVGQNTGG